MSFVDTNIFVAAFNIRDRSHKKGNALLQKALETFDLLYTSDYILDECLSVAWARTNKLEFAQRIKLIQELDHNIQESERIELLKVDESGFAAAKSYLRKFPKVIPTLTDWTSLVLMRDLDIRNILSFDDDFKKAKNRISEFSQIKVISDVSQLESF